MTTSSGLTRSKVCIKCGADKLLSGYGDDSRTPDGKAKTCADCKRATNTGGRGKKRSGGGKAVKSRKTAIPPGVITPPPAKLNGHLEVPPGLGFRASIEDSTLQIEQDRADEAGDVYTHTISLSAKEAAALVDWVADQVAA